VRYFPNIDIENVYSLVETRFEYSTNGIDFKTLFEVDSVVHSGWNFWVPENEMENI
jgi:hypothetical protein